MRVLRARYDSGEEFLRHYQPSLPGGGIFFPTRAVLPMGEPVVVEVRFPQLCNKTLIRGQVAWCRPGQHRAKLRAGLGIEFAATEVPRRDFLLATARGQGRAVVARRHRRLPVTLPAEWQRVPGRDVHRGVVEDIGPGGAFVRAGQPAPAGCEVVLGIVPPGGVRAIQIAGRVVWTRSAPGDEGFGVEFRCRDAGGARRLKELVRRLEQLEAQSLLESEDEGPLSEDP